MSPSPPPATINQLTTIQLGLVIMLASGIAAGAIWCTRTSLAIQDLRLAVEAASGDRWTATDMRVYVHQATREAELHAAATEQSLGLERGTLERFRFPDPDMIRTETP